MCNIKHVNVPRNGVRWGTYSGRVLVERWEKRAESGEVFSRVVLREVHSFVIYIYFFVFPT